MSNFYCEHCGAACYDSPQGYTTGCQHYPPDIHRRGRWPDSPMNVCYLNLDSPTSPPKDDEYLQCDCSFCRTHQKG